METTKIPAHFLSFEGLQLVLSHTRIRFFIPSEIDGFESEAERRINFFGIITSSPKVNSNPVTY
ncbi:hypothetical protein B2I23_05095 [Candidatus Liberibacter asiaticus]|nr:hypothetical protein B2I23_05095 [Candidatus Liberibacter asiaticus]KPG63272.1 hypothetical protein AL011_05000 [Candidatus Liberibacter asiaticus]